MLVGAGLLQRGIQVVIGRRLSPCSMARRNLWTVPSGVPSGSKVNSPDRYKKADVTPIAATINITKATPTNQREDVV